MGWFAQYLVQKVTSFDKTIENKSLFIPVVLVYVFWLILVMVDDKVEMNNETESYSSINTNDPKNVQELTQYVSLET